MGDSSLFVNGDDWVFTYPFDTGKYHIIGNGVEFIEIKEKHIVVKLDSQTELAVPKSRKHLLVNSSGIHDIEIDIANLPVNADLISTVIEALR